MGEVLIEIKNARFSYEGRTVVEGIDFAIKRGDYICVVGPNGSGKSTLVKGLLGIKPPSGGTVVCRGKVGIGYLPQRSSADDSFPATVFEIVASGLPGGIFPIISGSCAARAREAMQKLGIADLEKYSFGELSGGQRQRVLIARALCRGGDLLVLDEPTSALDPHISAEMYSLLDDLRREFGIAVVMVTHDYTAAARADKILHLDKTQLYFGDRAGYFAGGIGDDLWKGAREN